MIKRLVSSFEHNPVRYLGALASALVLVIPMFPSLAAVPAVAGILAVAEYVRSQVTPDAHIEKPTASQFLDMAIEANTPSHVEDAAK